MSSLLDFEGVELYSKFLVLYVSANSLYSLCILVVMLLVLFPVARLFYSNPLSLPILRKKQYRETKIMRMLT